MSGITSAPTRSNVGGQGKSVKVRHWYAVTVSDLLITSQSACFYDCCLDNKATTLRA